MVGHCNKSAVRIGAFINDAKNIKSSILSSLLLID